MDTSNIKLTTMDLASYIYRISNDEIQPLDSSSKRHLPDGCWMYILDRSEELPVPCSSSPDSNVLNAKDDESVASSVAGAMNGLVSSAMFSFRKNKNSKEKRDSTSSVKRESDSVANGSCNNTETSVSVTSRVMTLWYVILHWDSENVCDWYIECIDRTEYENRFGAEVTGDMYSNRVNSWRNGMKSSQLAVNIGNAEKEEEAVAEDAVDRSVDEHAKENSVDNDATSLDAVDNKASVRKLWKAATSSVRYIGKPIQSSSRTVVTDSIPNDEISQAITKFESEATTNSTGGGKCHKIPVSKIDNVCSGGYTIALEANINASTGNFLQLLNKLGFVVAVKHVQTVIDDEETEKSGDAMDKKKNGTKMSLNLTTMQTLHFIPAWKENSTLFYPEEVDLLSSLSTEQFTPLMQYQHMLSYSGTPKSLDKYKYLTDAYVGGFSACKVLCTKEAQLFSYLGKQSHVGNNSSRDRTDPMIDAEVVKNTDYYKIKSRYIATRSVDSVLHLQKTMASTKIVRKNEVNKNIPITNPSTETTHLGKIGSSTSPKINTDKLLLANLSENMGNSSSVGKRPSSMFISKTGVGNERDPHNLSLSGGINFNRFSTRNTNPLNSVVAPLNDDEKEQYAYFQHEYRRKSMFTNQDNDATQDKQESNSEDSPNRQPYTSFYHADLHPYNHDTNSVEESVGSTNQNQDDARSSHENIQESQEFELENEDIHRSKSDYYPNEVYENSVSNKKNKHVMKKKVNIFKRLFSWGNSKPATCEIEEDDGMEEESECEQTGEVRNQRDVGKREDAYTEREGLQRQQVDDTIYGQSSSFDNFGLYNEKLLVENDDAVDKVVSSLMEQYDSPSKHPAASPYSSKKPKKVIESKAAPHGTENENLQSEYLAPSTSPHALIPENVSSFANGVNETKYNKFRMQTLSAIPYSVSTQPVVHSNTNKSNHFNQQQQMPPPPPNAPRYAKSNPISPPASPSADRLMESSNSYVLYAVCVSTSEKEIASPGGIGSPGSAVGNPSDALGSPGSSSGAMMPSTLVSLVLHTGVKKNVVPHIVIKPTEFVGGMTPRIVLKLQNLLDAAVDGLESGLFRMTVRSKVNRLSNNNKTKKSYVESTLVYRSVTVNPVERLNVSGTALAWLKNVHLVRTGRAPQRDNLSNTSPNPTGAAVTLKSSAEIADNITQHGNVNSPNNEQKKPGEDLDYIYKRRSSYISGVDIHKQIHGNANSSQQNKLGYIPISTGSSDKIYSNEKKDEVYAPATRNRSKSPSKYPSPSSNKKSDDNYMSFYKLKRANSMSPSKKDSANKNGNKPFVYDCRNYKSSWDEWRSAKESETLNSKASFGDMKTTSSVDDDKHSLTRTFSTESVNALFEDMPSISASGNRGRALGSPQIISSPNSSNKVTKPTNKSRRASLAHLGDDILPMHNPDNLHKPLAAEEGDTKKSGNSGGTTIIKNEKSGSSNAVDQRLIKPSGKFKYQQQLYSTLYKIG